MVVDILRKLLWNTSGVAFQPLHCCADSQGLCTPCLEVLMDSSSPSVSTTDKLQFHLFFWIFFLVDSSIPIRNSVVKEGLASDVGS